MRVLVALHLHEGAESLLADATTWAQRMGAKLDVAYVDEYEYNLYLVEDPSVRTVLDEQWAKVHDSAKTRLDELVASLPEAVRGTALYLSGRASEQIVTAGGSRDAILIRTHGRTGVAHLLLGSVAEKVVRTATVPVIVLPPSPDEGE